jgi:hypothetical protein
LADGSVAIGEEEELIPVMSEWLWYRKRGLASYPNEVAVSPSPTAYATWGLFAVLNRR